MQPITTLKVETEVDEYGDVQDLTIPVSLAKRFVCGGVDDSFTLRFSVSVRGLDPSGFAYEVKSLIDAVKAAYDPEVMLKASCEELAGGVISTLWSYIGSRLEAAHAEVDNLTGSVRVDWTKGDEVPRFPRRATKAEIAESASRDRC